MTIRPTFSKKYILASIPWLLSCGLTMLQDWFMIFLIFHYSIPDDDDDECQIIDEKTALLSMDRTKSLDYTK